MEWVHIFLSLMLCGPGRAELSTAERPYKILMLLPSSGLSHRNIFITLAEALAERGHKIDILSSYDLQHQNPNIREIPHGVIHVIPNRNINVFTVKARFGTVSLKTRLCTTARDLYQVPHVKDLYKRRKEYDLLVIDHMFNELAYPFAHEMPFITISCPGMDPRQSAILGNPLNPAYVPSFFNEPDLNRLFGRLANAIDAILFSFYWRHWDAVPAIQKEVNLHFPDLPPLLDIERNQSLVLINSHFSTSLAVPLLPSQVEIGGMHCRPANSLPKDLNSWIEEVGSKGVIYFSLGSVTRGDTLPAKYKNMFIEAFSKLEQRVLWKFETEIKGVPKNVMISQWFPQQDILGHPNVKVFISHGGLLSLHETLYHGTPVVVLPIFADQYTNRARIVANEWGLSLDYETLSVDLILSSLKEVIANPKYRENVLATSKMFKDQLNSPVERAVFWTEYVIRHKGALKLRSPAASLTWVQFLLLDVLAVCLIIMILSLIILKWIWDRIR